ncbi:MULTISPECIES: PH domain-containing protein [unclassified Streptomyces]|uniref:PH domain-containing protein n=1 Tax=unclassified Streptomyces TaxID=2593676 RepID=UPI0035D99A7F
MTAVRVRVLEGPPLVRWLCAETALTWVCVTVVGVLGPWGDHPTRWFVPTCLLLPVVLHYALRGRFAVRLDDAGITVVRPWSRRRVPWAEVGGIRFTPLPVEEDDIAWWAVTTTVGAARTLPLATVRDTDEPAFGTLRRHGLLFRPFADRGLGVLGTPEDSRAHAYFERAVRAAGGRSSDGR